MKIKKQLKLYITRKYIFATSVKDALKKDKTQHVDDCWLDEDYKKQLVPAMGFAHYPGEVE